MTPQHPPLVGGRWRAVLGLAGSVALALAALVGPAAPAAASTSLQVYLTTADGTSQLSAQSNVTLGAVARGSVNVTVTDSQQYQTMSAGFGASFTDSSTSLLKQLKSYSLSSYNTIMNDLVSSSSGIGLNFWRLPMSSSDFNSTGSPWTDDDTQGPSNNPTQYFALTSMETGHIIPVIKDALAINSNLKFVASPWSAPAWMKTNNSMICYTGGNNSYLQTQYNQAWADYFVKWIQAYQAQGIPIWGITPQNEPQYCPNSYPGMVWSATDEGNWVKNYLAPTLAANGLSPVIMGLDHNWDQSAFAQSLMSGGAASYFPAMAWHCYDNTSDPTVMTQLHNGYTGEDQYETECSSDTQPTDIIPFSTPQMALLSAQNWAKGAILWNAVLNSSNGPHLGGCTSCVPLITVDTTVDGNGNVTSASSSLRNNYYQFGQVSKFVNVGATRIGSTVNAHGVVTAAFKNSNGQEVLVATNTNSSSTSFEVTWNGQGSFSYTLPSRATVTFIGTVAAAPTMPSTLRAGQTYKFVNRTSGKPFGVSGASTADGAKIVQWTDDADADQQWAVVDAGSGYDYLIDVNSGKALDDTDGSTSNGTQMQQWTMGTGNANQQWQISSLGNGYYTVTNRHSGLVLDLANGSVADNTAIQQWAYGSGNSNQQWQLVGVPAATTAATPTAGQTYRLVSAATGKPIDVSGASTSDGALLVENADNDGVDQQWTLAAVSGGYFNLVNVNSGKAMDDPGGSTSNGTQMQQWTIVGSGNSNQQWTITSRGGGYYTVANRTSGLVLDVAGGSSSDGTAIQQWSYSSGDLNQEFLFLPAT